MNISKAQVPTLSNVVRKTPDPLCQPLPENRPLRSLEPLRKPSRLNPQEAKAQLRRHAGQVSGS